MTASQWTMFGLIGELTSQSFVLPVLLTSHIQQQQQQQQLYSVLPFCTRVTD